MSDLKQYAQQNNCHLMGETGLLIVCREGYFLDFNGETWHRAYSESEAKLVIGEGVSLIEPESTEPAPHSVYLTLWNGHILRENFNSEDDAVRYAEKASQGGVVRDYDVIPQNE